MKIKGVAGTIDELGRIVIPKEFRKSMGVEPKDLLELSLVGNTITCKKLEKSCIICSEEGDHLEFENKIICLNCLKKLKSI